MIISHFFDFDETEKQVSDLTEEVCELKESKAVEEARLFFYDLAFLYIHYVIKPHVKYKWQYLSQTIANYNAQLSLGEINQQTYDAWKSSFENQFDGFPIVRCTGNVRMPQSGTQTW